MSKLLLIIFFVSLLLGCSEPKKNFKSQEVYQFYPDGAVKSIGNFQGGGRPVKYSGFYIVEMYSVNELKSLFFQMGFFDPSLHGVADEFSGLLSFPVDQKNKVQKLIDAFPTDSLMPDLHFCWSLSEQELPGPNSRKVFHLYALKAPDDEAATFPGWKIRKVETGKDNGGEINISVELTDEGARHFERMSTKNVGRSLAMVIDNRVICAPHVNSPIIGGNLEISGGFTVAEAANIEAIINSYILNGELRKYTEKGKLKSVTIYKNGEQEGRSKIVK